MDNKFASIGISTIFGVSAFVIAVVLGSVLTISTGIPLIGGLINGVFTGMVLTIGLLSRRFFFNATIMWLVFSILASPTATLGPPGLYKIFIGVFAGLIWDLLYGIFYNTKFRRYGLYLGGIVGSASIMLLLVLALSFGFGTNAELALEKYQTYFFALLAVNIIITFFGIYLGEFFYNNRLIDLTAFKNISNRND